jgi:DNA topoisomerase VI subunit B
VREFVENSLDAAESVHVLPTVEVTMYAERGKLSMPATHEPAALTHAPYPRPPQH